MSFKVCFIGAGSIGFTRGLIRDMLSVPELRDIQISLMDISAENLDMVRQLCQKDMEANGIMTKIQATTDRRAALKDAKYVICCARIGGLEAMESDVEIPMKYGVDQCVGDTLCAGGIMYGQRGINFVLDLCKDIREVALPGAMLINYANPMAMMTWACRKYAPDIPMVGLCHGVQGGRIRIAHALGLPWQEVDYIAAGINHQTWFISVKHKGIDYTDQVLEALEKDPYSNKTEFVRIDMTRRFGYFSTESNGHLSEYLPWYRKRHDEIRQWINLDSWVCGESAGYLRDLKESRNWFIEDFPNWMKADAAVYCEENRSKEHASFIIESIETGRTYKGWFNVVNNGCIPNLPSDAIIEVPGFVDGNGIRTPYVGELPLGCAAVCNASISVQRLAVEAAVHGDDMLLRQAMLMDPLVGASLNPPEVWQMVDELLVAQEQWLPQYKKSIEAAKARVAKGLKVPIQNYKGACRLKEKTVKEMAKNAQAAREHAGKSDKTGQS